MELAPGAVGRAMWTEVRWRGRVPKALERWTRRMEPGAETCTVSRRVASVRSAEGRAFWVSGICWEVDQVPVQDWAWARVGRARAAARKRRVRGRMGSLFGFGRAEVGGGEGAVGEDEFLEEDVVVEAEEFEGVVAGGDGGKGGVEGDGVVFDGLVPVALGLGEGLVGGGG